MIVRVARTAHPVTTCLFKGAKHRRHLTQINCELIVCYLPPNLLMQAQDNRSTYCVN